MSAPLLDMCRRNVRHKAMHTLSDYIAANGPRTDQEWADFFEISRPHFHGLRSGRDLPSRKLIERIAEKTGGKVSPASWFAPQAPARKGAA